MDDLKKSWLNAMFTIAQKTVDEVSSDKTIKAIVKKVINTSEGKYLVSHGDGSDIYAYTQSGSTEVYQINEQVYVLIPEDDMSQKKFIIGKVKEDEEFFFKDSTDLLLNDYVPIGNNAIIDNGLTNIDGLSVKRMQPFTLNSHEPNSFYCCYLRDPSSNITGSNIEYNTLDNPAITIDEETFINSAKKAEALLLRAKFKANIDTDNIGNYGIIVNIAFKDKMNGYIDDNGNITYPSKLIAYVLDTSKMTGNPMKFYDYNSQYIIADFDGEDYLYIDSIIAFSEGFVDESTEQHNEFDDIDIYVDDLEILALSEITAVSGDYKLRLTTPKGSTVRMGSKADLKIIATMTYLNQDVTENTVFYWGVRDFSISSTSEKYNAKLGANYRYLDTENKSELEIPFEDLTAIENNYICVAVYESDIILKATVLIYNNNNQIDITIESDKGNIFQFDEGNPILTCLINGKSHNYDDSPDDVFSFIWSREDKDFNTIILDATEAQLEDAREQELLECRVNENSLSNAGRNSIQVLSYYATRIAQIKDVTYLDGVHGSRIQCKLKNANVYVTYYCSVYKAGVYLGYGSITLQNAKNKVNNNYHINITNGNQVFQYDERGIAPNSEKKQSQIEVLDLIATFYSPQGTEIIPKKVRWVVPQENTLIDIPSLGLETDIETNERYYSGNIFPLKIKENYDITCNNNQIIAVVTHTDGTEYRQSTNLLFTKIGEIGTNGTDTVIRINEILPNIPSDERLTIIKPVEGEPFYNDNINPHSKTYKNILEANIYTNNTQVLGYTTKWTIAGTSKTQGQNYKVIGNEDDNYCKVNYNGLNTELDTRIIKAMITLNGKYYYSYYGLPAIEYQQTDSLEENEKAHTYENYPIKILKDGTLKSILYDSNGTNPTYDNHSGIYVDFPGWEDVSFIDWKVESGLKTSNANGFEDYTNPNILLSKNYKSVAGSRELVAPDLASSEEIALTIQTFSENCLENAPSNIKQYIGDFLTDIEKIGVNNLLPTENKLNSFYNRLNDFINENNVPNENNAYILNVYNKYLEFYNIMNNEYKSCKARNSIFKQIYDTVQDIWNSKWPHVITQKRLCIKDYRLNIDDLIDKYKKAYLNNLGVPDRSILFEDNFINYLTQVDNYYDGYITMQGISTQDFNPILVEYIKILVAYINLLVQETQTYLNDFNTSSDEGIIEIRNKYGTIYQDWNWNNIENRNNVISNIGKNIYEIIDISEGNINDIYDKVRGLYNYYQTLYLNIKMYQIEEESSSLNIWNSVLNGFRPELLNKIYIVPNNNNNNIFNGLYMNNNVVGTVYIKKNDIKKIIAKIYVPIIMTLNTHELAALNGWDGTSIEIEDDHIVAPQVGAGIKDEKTNLFTGMVMGSINNTSDDNDNSITTKIKKANKVGLIGYSNGIQSLFIDAETGKTCFGLPSDDKETNIDEGRIELVPGGVSKIGNWKIGNRFLYNIVDGTYELRRDNGSRTPSINKLMIPHAKEGIILSSDQPYIHIKTKPTDSTNLIGINYRDEYNDINPGDSLELRLDPNNHSLFSIIQHTQGFGDEDDPTLFYGYRISDPDDDVIIVSDYIANKNSAIEDQENYWQNYNPEYFIYSFAKDSQDNYIPYYKTTNNVQGNAINIEEFNGYYNNNSNENILLQNSLSFTKFKKALSIDPDTGMITYSPDNLVWENGQTGSSNNDGWQSITKQSQYNNNQILIDFNYNKNIINTNNYKHDFTIGTINNLAGKDFKQLEFKYIVNKNSYLNLSLDYWKTSYVQFYVIRNSEKILESDQINIQNYNEIAVAELFSVNNRALESNKQYDLHMILYVESYTVDSSCSCIVNRSKVSTKTMPISNFETIEITNPHKSSTQTGRIGNISYEYRFENNGNKVNFEFRLPGNTKTYDFVIWRPKGNPYLNEWPCCGQLISAQKAKFFNKEFVLLENLSEIKTFFDNATDGYDNLPTEENPIYITLYQRGEWTDEADGQYKAKTTMVGLNKRYLAHTYLTDKEIYSIDWTTTENTYNNLNAINWGIILKNKYKENNVWKWTIQDIKGIVPGDSGDVLCIKTENDYLKGIPYAKTYWVDDVQYIQFYDNYYAWMNNSNNRRNKQYGYINVIQNNVYYKYIKTLPKNVVDSWFLNKNTINDVIAGSSWIAIPANSDLVKQEETWKEFIRVGLDENGRFFTAGAQDRETYSRTGRLQAFGKIFKLFYGQEVRAQINDSSNYYPIIKIFSNLSNSNTVKTTYITQGSNDNGNISIRTAESGTVELVANEKPEDSLKTTLNKSSKISVNCKNGIIFDSTYITDNNQTSTNKLTLNNKGTSLISNTITFSGGNIAENPSSSYQMIDDYSWIRTKKYVLSSIDARSASNAYSAYSLDNHYRIKAAMEGYDTDAPFIQLQVGKNKAGLEIKKDEINLMTTNQAALKISHPENNNIITGSFKVGDAELQLQKVIDTDNSNNNIIKLGNNNTEISMDKESISIGLITADGKITIKKQEPITFIGSKGLLVKEGPSIFKGEIYAESNINLKNTLYCGSYKDEDGNKQTTIGNIILYKGTDEDSAAYVKIQAQYLKSLFDWYNKKRWSIAVSGNTVFIKNVANNNEAEGIVEKNKNDWQCTWLDSKKFNGYKSGWAEDN